MQWKEEAKSNMNNMMGGFEDIFEKGQSAASDAVKKAVTDTANSAKGQILGGQASTSGAPSDHGSNEAGNSTQNQPQMSDEERVRYLKDLYGPSVSKSGKTESKPNVSIKDALGLPELNKKSPEEEAKEEAVKQQLHQEYFRSLTARPRHEESVVDKLEREDHETQMAELESKKDKPTPINPSVKTGTGETVASSG